jgi:Protein of unknown function (DUF1236)
MNRLIGTATVAALAALVPFATLAQAGRAPNPPNQPVQAEVKKALEAAGFRDVEVEPSTFVVRAKDPAGSPVMMVISPEAFRASAAPELQENIDTSSSKSGSSQSGPPSQNGHEEPATGSLGDANGRYQPTLTPGQKQAIWDSLSSEKTMRAKRRVGYAPRVGATVPRNVPIRPLPEDVTNDVPALTGYHFAVAGNEIVIVSPTSKKVLDIFGEQ